ncbi:glycosyltransferase family 2 protein [Candidatus Roizmanbacteria bacterium]|nr:glycosyltransferase family 2 protein [Candidatus Roizmanbacteria bacterium]
MNNKDQTDTLIKENDELKAKIEYLMTHTQNLEIILNKITNAKAFKLWQNYNKGKKIVKYILQNPSKVLKVGKVLITQGPKTLYQNYLAYEKTSQYIGSINEQYQVWFKKHWPNKKDLDIQQSKSLLLQYKPLISIVVPTYNTNHVYLRECIQSVLNQSYQNWELCIVDDNSSDPEIRTIIKEYAHKNRRIKYQFRKSNGHISLASNDALALTTGEFVGLLDHDDILWPNALFEVVNILNSNKKLDLIYSDEDKIDFDGITHVDPFFKPDWSPDYLRSINYITHFSVLRKSDLVKIGGFRKGYEGAQDWDLLLRFTRKTNAIAHIPTILYSWRKSETSTASEKHVTSAKSYAFINQKKALESDAKARFPSSEVLETKYLGLWRVRYFIQKNPLVSIIIPTKDKFEYIRSCLNSIYSKTTYNNFEVIVVDTGSSDQKVIKLYEELSKVQSKFKLLNWDKIFNFSDVCNVGAHASNGEFLIFLNNDTEVITPDWIEGLLELAQLPHIGTVGPKLYYANRHIQHAGVILGLNGVANHVMNNELDERPQSFPMLYAKDAIRDISAVTGACLMIKKSLFFRLNGFDPAFKIAFNDIDLCLRVSSYGLFNVYTPFVQLYHYENVSVGNPFEGTRNFKEFMKENNDMYNKWNKLIVNDPLYNRNLTLTSNDFSLRQ